MNNTKQKLLDKLLPSNLQEVACRLIEADYAFRLSITDSQPELLLIIDYKLHEIREHTLCIFNDSSGHEYPFDKVEIILKEIEAGKRDTKYPRWCDE